MLISTSYFWGELLIGGLSNPLDGNISDLNKFIAKYEDIYCRILLGDVLYESFLSGLSAPSVLQKWIELKDKLRNETTKVSPIANYVYYHYLINLQTSTSILGEVKAKIENAENVNSINKQVRAWNEMVDLTKKIHSFILENISDYETYEPLFGRYNELFYYKNSLNL